MIKLLASIFGVLLLAGCAPQDHSNGLVGRADPPARSDRAVAPAPSGVLPVKAIATSLPDPSIASPGRLFLVLLDSSKSYKDYEVAIQGLQSACANLGPGDRLVIARITANMDPKAFIVISASAKSVSPEVFSPSHNLEEWRGKRRVFEAAWQKSLANLKVITAVLQQLRGANSSSRTDLHGALEYSLDWLRSQPGDEKTLIIFSDLEHDTGKPTFDPPLDHPDLNGLRVNLLFVSYGNKEHWQVLEKAWRKYFASAASFEMDDSGRSSNARVIPPSAVPRQLTNPLQTRSGN